MKEIIRKLQNHHFFFFLVSILLSVKAVNIFSDLWWINHRLIHKFPHLLLPSFLLLQFWQVPCVLEIRTRNSLYLSLFAVCLRRFTSIYNVIKFTFSLSLSLCYPSEKVYIYLQRNQIHFLSLFLSLLSVCEVLHLFIT